MNAGLNGLRFFLAFNVVLFHLWNAAAPGAGPVAVLGFFFISGYLITQIVQEVYPMPARAGAFLLNRTLRIYPQYAGALALGLLGIHVYPDVAGHVNSYLRWPAGAAEWAPQLAIFGLDHSDVRVLPAAWTLATELVFYLLIGLGTARSKRASLVLCLISAPVALACALKVLPFSFYGSPIGNGFVFALGSAAYFQRRSMRVELPVFLLACAAYAVHLYAVPALEAADVDNANLAGSVLPFAVIVAYLVQHEVRSPALVAVLDALGKVAYPVFLLHWAVCVLVSAWLFEGLASFDMVGPWRGAEYFTVSFVASVACAGVFQLAIGAPVERLRRLVRGRGAGRGTRTLSWPGSPAS